MIQFRQSLSNALVHIYFGNDIIGYYTLMAIPYKEKGFEYHYFLHYLPNDSSLFVNDPRFAEEVLVNTHMMFTMDKQNNP